MLEMLVDILESFEAGEFDLHKREDWCKNLQQLGVKEKDITEFLTVIESIGVMQKLVLDAMPKGGFSFRIYNEEEKLLLDHSCRGLLLHMEQCGLLPPELREIVIEQVVRLKDFKMDECKLRVMLLLVLFQRSGVENIIDHYGARKATSINGSLKEINT